MVEYWREKGLLQQKGGSSPMQTHNGKLARASSRRAARPAGTPPAEEGIASSGITFHLWRLYQHAWLVCLLFPFASLVREPLSLWRLISGLLALLFFATSYTWLMWPHPTSQEARARSRSLLSFLLFGVLGLLTFVFSLMYGPAWLWLFIGVSAIAGVLLPMRSAFAAVVLFTLLPLFLTLKMHGGLGGVDVWWFIALMLLVRGLGLDMIGVARMGSAIRELHSARRELARLAVIEERERLSRDLHDLLGQTLSMITLKSELAGCLIKEDPERCAQELAEIECVSRKTLREVREAVAGYRQPTLSSELEGARQLLAAAGIDVEIEPINEVLPPAFDAALAWTVREGVTNVIRHSRARQCRIHLTKKNGAVMAEVLSEGGQREQVESTVRPGLGLAGLRERVSALGGRMKAGPLTLSGKEHFRVRVELPLQQGVAAPVFQEERL
jgi:two-component system, NarL family, sensor histidine kinase DesK